jgi:RimJ/RimL family protein N-acetyltransferase
VGTLALAAVCVLGAGGGGIIPSHGRAPAGDQDRTAALGADRAAHPPDLQFAVAASRAELGPWLPFAQESPEDTLDFVRRSPLAWRRGLAHTFCIVRDGQALGTVGVRRSQGQIGEIGYWLRSDATGQGFVTEAGRAVVDFSFGALSLERLELVAGVENHASNRVAEKLSALRGRD